MATIAELNDELRKSIVTNAWQQTKNKVVMSSSISFMQSEDRMTIFTNVAEFKDFTKGDNPYGENDFGAFSHNGTKIFWKIDYYDNDMKYHSPDNTDPEKTIRLLTIMTASEW